MPLQMLGHSTDIDSDKAGIIAREFFMKNYTSFIIINIILKHDIWFVKGFVTSFGKQSIRVIAIESKTGRIISSE